MIGILTLFEWVVVVEPLCAKHGCLAWRLTAFLLASCFSAGLDLHKYNLLVVYSFFT